MEPSLCPPKNLGELTEFAKQLKCRLNEILKIAFKINRPIDLILFNLRLLPYVEAKWHEALKTLGKKAENKYMEGLESDTQKGVDAFRWLYLTRYFLEIALCAEQTDGVREVNSEIHELIHPIADVIAELEKDSFIRAIYFEDSTFQCRVTEKGQVLLEIIRDILPDMFAFDANTRVPQAVMSGELAQKWQNLANKMPDSEFKIRTDRAAKDLQALVDKIS
jgi:hypothetical protein